MKTMEHNRLAGVLDEEVARIRSNWGWVMTFGVVQLIVGALAISFAFSATIASVVTLGIVLLVAAGAQIAAAIWWQDWGGFFLYLLLSILYGAAGLVMLAHPLAAAESLTLLLAAACLVGGTFRIVMALVERFSSWGWVLLNGVITILVGLLIMAQWPESGIWVLGMFVGIDLIFNGATWTALAAGIRGGLAKATGR